MWKKIKYEKVADFCFGYGQLGNVMKNCEIMSEGRDMVEGRMRFGLWIKVAHMKDGEM